MPAITIISALPHYVSREEHAEITSRTPENFSDIPPVLRRKEEGVRVALEPPLPDWTPDDLKGTLYIIESALAFMGPGGKGFQIEYPKITLHAISRGSGGASIYCQLDEQPGGAAEAPEDEDSEMSELNIYPGDANAVEPMFEALSACASLHPDPKNIGEELDEDGGIAFDGLDDTGFELFTGGPEEELSEVGRVRSDFVNDNRYQPY